jgi:hypothetical protein
MQRYMSYVRSEKRCAAIVDRGMTWCVEGAGLFFGETFGASLGRVWCLDFDYHLDYGWDGMAIEW